MCSAALSRTYSKPEPKTKVYAYNYNALCSGYVITMLYEMQNMPD